MSTTMKKTYFELAKEAILTLKDRTGSSNQTIKAFIVNKYPSINFQQHLLRAALKKGVAAGKLLLVKASYKLSTSELKPKSIKNTKSKDEPKKIKKSVPVKNSLPSTPTKVKKSKMTTPKKVSTTKSPNKTDDPFLRKNKHETRTHLGRSLSQVIKQARNSKKTSKD